MKRFRAILIFLVSVMLIFGSVSAVFAEDAEGSASVNATSETQADEQGQQALDESANVDEDEDEDAAIQEDTGKDENAGKKLKQYGPKIAETVKNRNMLRKEIKELEKSMKEQFKMLRWALANRKAVSQQQELLKDYEEAMALLNARLEQLKVRLEEQVEAREELAALFREKATIHEEAGELDEARDSLEEAVSVAPDDANAYNSLNDIFAKLKDKKIKVYVKGKKPQFDVPPVIKDGRTLVPVRAITEALGAQVTYDPQARQAVIVKDDVTVVLTLGERVAMVNGTPVSLGVPAETANSRILVPLRFLSEIFDKKVDWYQDGQMIVIN